MTSGGVWHIENYVQGRGALPSGKQSDLDVHAVCQYVHMALGHALSGQMRQALQEETGRQ